MKNLLVIFLGILSFSQSYASDDLKENDVAPAFTAQTHEGKSFDLTSRKGKWTVLYFYPKADTPGCTKQACSFRDNIKKVRALGAEVYGISADSVENQAKFHEKYHLTFDLLADPKADIIKAYGTKMPMIGISKRWTFIVDPELRIREIAKGVDPVADSDRVAKRIQELQGPQKIK